MGISLEQIITEDLALLRNRAEIGSKLGKFIDAGSYGFQQRLANRGAGDFGSDLSVGGRKQWPGAGGSARRARAGDV